MQGDPVGPERVEDLRGDVLVVERDDVAVAGEGPHRLDVGVVTHRGGGDDERGGRVDGLGEHGELHAELDGRTLHHPSQLPTADDADHREAAGRAPWVRREATRPVGRRLAGGGHGTEA